MSQKGHHSMCHDGHGKKHHGKKKSKSRKNRQDAKKWRCAVLSPGMLKSVRAQATQFNGKDINLNRLSRGLNAILWVTLNDSLNGRPYTLVRIGLELQDIKHMLPQSYAETYDIPLNVQQLAKFLAHKKSIAYVQEVFPGTIGPKVLEDMAQVVECLSN